LNITLIVVGKFKNDFVKEGFEEYLKRINLMCNFKLIEVKEEKNTNDSNQIKIEEGKRILKLIENKELILLEVEGKSLTSKQFADFIKKNENKDLAFVVGGHLGFSEEVLNKAKYKISLSNMTFPHQLIRLIFIEQLYRSFTINKNIPYHK
jgi:23S rRNA (pseudouridine1915-N3)-methyltransferase